MSDMQSQTRSAALLASQIYLQYLNDFLLENAIITQDDYAKMAVKLRNWNNKKSMENAPIITD